MRTFLNFSSSVPMSSKKDLWIVLGIVIIALLMLIPRFMPRLFGSDDMQYATITLDGEIVKQVNLNENRIFSIEERPNVVFEVRDGAIAFTIANCPDQICVNMGFIRHRGQMAVCLPNRLLLSVHVPVDNGNDFIDIDIW